MKIDFSFNYTVCHFVIVALLTTASTRVKSDTIRKLTLDFRTNIEVSKLIAKPGLAIMREGVAGKLVYPVDHDTIVHFGAHLEAVQKLTPNSYTSLDIREAFTTRYFDFGAISIGLQQVNWTTADRLLILDRLHSFDQSEFMRIPLEARRPDFMLHSVYDYSHSAILEAIIIPVSRVNSTRRDSRYARPFPDQFTSADARESVPSGIQISKFGLRFQKTTNAADYTLVVIHGPSTEGAYRTALSNELAPLIITEHQVETVVGGSFERPISTYTLRGEFSYIHARHRSVISSSGLAITSFPQVNIMLGLDWMPENWFIGTQLAYTNLIQTSGLLLEEKSRFLVTLSIERKIDQGQYKFSAFLSKDIRKNDTWINTEFSWFPFPSPHSLSIGSDFFSGTESGLFGYYKDEDRVYLRVTTRW